MKRIFFCLAVFPVLVFTQTVPTIVSLDVDAVLDEQTGALDGTVDVTLTNTDSGAVPFTFYVPTAWTIRSVKDRREEAFDAEPLPSDRNGFTFVSLSFPVESYHADTLGLTIEFSMNADTSAFGAMFNNPREFFLMHSDTLSWLPLFGSATAGRSSLIIRISPEYTLMSDVPFASDSAEGIFLWRSSSPHPISMASAFTLCGIRNARRTEIFSSDSSSSASITFSPDRFHPRLAEAIVRQCADALQYFTTKTQRSGNRHLAIAVAGNPDVDRRLYHSHRLNIIRNSPVFASSDSGFLQHLLFNRFLTDAAKEFSPLTTESSFLFREGFSFYIASRFLGRASLLPDRAERFAVLSSALSFFPAGSLAVEKYRSAAASEMAATKGLYFFFMLEYLLGQESIDSVVARISNRFPGRPIGFADVQQLCEEEYGKPLEWFFSQWLYRESAPEYVMQWKHERTPRGMWIVTTTIEQRGEVFAMPVPLIFSFGRRTITKRVMIDQPRQEMTFVFPSPPASVELDPRLMLFRWLRELRISAHAKTAAQFLLLSRDTAGAAYEARYTLQLDPNNITGSAPLVYFVLGTLRAAAGEFEQSKEYFMMSYSSSASKECERYRLLGLLHYGRILELSDRHDEAVRIYRRVLTEGAVQPNVHELAMIKAERLLRGAYDEHQTAFWLAIP